jgi:glycosyltransferase involved in cell wall biosynthesis
MDSPKVSIIIPTYRHGDFILRTLDSVFSQTMQDYEIIVVNDGSPDDTEAVLSELIASRRIRYFKQVNQGQSVARNRGLELALGKYIAFLDDDDLWPVDKLEWQTDFLENNPNTSTIGGVAQAVDANDLPVWKDKFHPLITYDSLFAGNPFLSPGQTLVRTDVLRELGGMNPRIWGADDWDLWFRIAQKFKIEMIDRLALYYRLHAGNASKQSARMLKACSVTIDLHLQNLPPARRRQLRQTAYHKLYCGYGPGLVADVRKNLRQAKTSQAARSFSGLTPLIRIILFDSFVRGQFLRELFVAPLKRLFFKAR